MAELLLLPSNRMQSNKAQQWLPAKGCALLHKDTLGPVCWNLCEFKVCQSSFQGGLDFTFWLALNYLHDMLST